MRIGLGPRVDTASEGDDPNSKLLHLGRWIPAAPSGHKAERWTQSGVWCRMTTRAVHGALEVYSHTRHWSGALPKHC
ncbi:hypothetical protein chiPu_0021776 [Chiloscyllium punctatum]|uniref:Uncharacterized protein n=1 Tax=Chiloscyllium punctatum TaxID=137246 RepID=A0A401RLT6_CHIPU|nr:hypothetical protein [Chiloscyllium punctatum]